MARHTVSLLLLQLVVVTCILAATDAQSLRGGSGSSHNDQEPAIGFSALDSANTSSVHQTAAVSSSPGSSYTSAKGCDWQGKTLRHNTATYFVGRAHRRGSIFGECKHGALTCYEDTGMADTPTAQFRVLPCASTTFVKRQYDLDSEDARLLSG